MKLSHVATITTALVIIVGICLISPMFFRVPSPKNQPHVALFLYVTGEGNSTSWCREVGSHLGAETKATVFFIGEVVDENPEIVSSFGPHVDWGSLTYHYRSLLSSDDYTAQLLEIQEGKMAVDAAVNVDSKLFAAPFGIVNNNIFSQLKRSGITADFSYSDHYNKLWNGTFITMPLKFVEGLNLKFGDLPKNANDPPTVIIFHSTTSSAQVIQTFQELKEAGFGLLSASDIVGFDLIERGS